MWISITSLSLINILRKTYFEEFASTSSNFLGGNQKLVLNGIVNVVRRRIVFEWRQVSHTLMTLQVNSAIIQLLSWLVEQYKNKYRKQII